MKRPIQIEIFRAGRHKAMDGTIVEFTESDLAQIAKVYSPTVHEAPVVLGHPKDNAPAYGWARTVSAKGPSLRSTLDQVDLSFADAVRDGRYKKVSASFYKKDSPSNPTPGQYYLRHIGFLGAQPPAVKGLAAVEFAGTDDDCLTLEFSEGTEVNLAEEAADAVASEASAPTVEAVTTAVTAELRNAVATALRTSLGESLTTGLSGTLTAALGEGADATAVQAAVAEAVKAALGEAEGGESPLGAAVEAAITEALGDPLKAAIEGAVQGALKPALASAITEVTDTVDNSESWKPKPGPKTAAERALEAREQKLRDKEKALRVQEHTSFVESVLAEGRRLPAPKAQVVDLLEHLEVSGESVSFGEGDQAKSPLVLVKAIVSKLPREVELRELGDPKMDLAFSEESDPADVARAAQAYQAEQRKIGNLVSTTDAVKYVKGI